MTRKHPSERIAEIAARFAARRPPTVIAIVPTPARSDVREACLLSHRAACERGVLVGRRTPAALVGALLAEMSAESAMTLLEIAIRHARAIVEDEKPAPLAEVLNHTKPNEEP